MEWDPTQYFRDGVRPPVPFALLVLNQPINGRAFTALKKHGEFPFGLNHIQTALISSVSFAFL